MKRDVQLWAAVLIGPIVWFVSFGAIWTLAGWKPAIYIISLAALAIAAGSGLLGWTQWQQLGRQWPGEAGGAVARSRWLAISGILLSAMFFLVILAQGIVELMLGGSQ